MSVFRGASVGVTLTANKSRYSKELKAARSEMRDWERTVERSMGRARRGIGAFGRAAAVGLAVAGVAAGAAGVKMVQMAGDAAEVDSKLEATFGKRRLANIAADLDRFSEATGASRYQLRQQVADVGALLKPMGMASAQMDDMSVRTVQLATDLSSFNNVPVDEALQALRSGLTGETEPLKRFGILINAAAIETEALNAGLAKTKDEITESDKVQARFNLIMRDTKLQQGDAIKTADSYANTVRNIQNSVRDAGTEIGQKMLPTVTELANGLSTFVRSDKFAGYVEGVGDAAQSAVVGVTNFMRSADGQRILRQTGEAARAAADGVQFLGGAALDSVQFLSRHETATKAAAIALGAMFVTSRVAAGMSVLSAAVNLATARTVMFMQATKGATVAQRALMLASLTNPFTALAAGMVAVGVAAGAFLNHQRNAQNEMRKAAQSALEEVRALQSLRDVQLQLSGDRVGVERSALAVERAERTYRDTVRQSGRGSLEAREAAVALKDARIQHRAAVDQERKSIQEANRQSGISQAHAFRAQTALRDESRLRAHLADLRSRLSRETNGEERRELRRQETLTKQHLGKLEKAHGTNQQVLTAALKGGLVTRRELMAREGGHLATTARQSGRAAGQALGQGMLEGFGSAMNTVNTWIAQANQRVAQAAASAQRGGGGNARSARDLAKGGAKRVHPLIRQARTQAAIEASPVRALAQANRQFTQAVAALKRAKPKDRAERAQAVRDAAANVVQREISLQQARAAAKQEKAARDQEAAAKKQEEAAEAARVAAEQRQAALDAPRTAMTLVDAMRDLERAQAEATATLADDIEVARRALADEQSRQAQINAVLARTDLSAEERAALVDQLSASVRTTTQLTSSIADMTGATTAGSSGATLDDLLAQLKAATRAIYEAGATEAGNVFAISKLEQVVQGGSTDFWALQTQAQLQGAVGA